MDDEQDSGPQSAPEASLEDMIRESLEADAAPGIPTPIDYGLPVSQRTAELPLAEESALAPPEADQSDMSYVESAEPEMLPHEYAHPFPESSEGNEESATLSEDFGPETVESSDEQIEIPVSPAPTESSLPDVTLPDPPTTEESTPLPSAATDGTEIDEQIPLPEMQQQFSDQGSPFVFPDSGNAYQQTAAGEREINVTMEMPDQRELMEKAREQIEPLFRRVEQSFSGALEDAFDIESELMDRRNNY